MGIADFNFKLIEDVKAKIDSLNIGFNKEEKKLIIESLDQSQHVHIHNEIGLSDEAILSLPSEKVGDFLKQRAFLNLQVACKDNPQKMNEMLTLYSATAISTSTGIITATSPNLSPIPSGDFIQELPGAIKSIRFVTIGEDVKKESRNDLIKFIKNWQKSNLNIFNYLNQNLQSYENEIGLYRFDKLIPVLKELKICNATRGRNNNLAVVAFSIDYSDKDIVAMLRDINSGRYDHLL